MATSSDSAPLYSIWTVQDSLLQAYRTMLITAASLLLGLAAGTKSWKAALVLILLSWLLQTTWWLVTRARARNVQFAQRMILLHEAGQYVAEPLATFKKFQDSERGGPFEFEVSGSDGQKGRVEFRPEAIWPPKAGWRIWKWPTRLQMEIVLPVTYALCGLAILGIQVLAVSPTP